MAMQGHLSHVFALSAPAFILLFWVVPSIGVLLPLVFAHLGQICVAELIELLLAIDY